MEPCPVVWSHMSIHVVFLCCQSILATFLYELVYHFLLVCLVYFSHPFDLPFSAVEHKKTIHGITGPNTSFYKQKMKRRVVDKIDHMESLVSICHTLRATTDRSAFISATWISRSDPSLVEYCLPSAALNWKHSWKNTYGFQVVLYLLRSA